MNHAWSAALLALGVASLPSISFAHVGSGNSNSCMGCHTPGTGHLEISAPKQTNLGVQLDGASRGSLDTFEVSPGGLVTLPITVTNGSSQYGFSINELLDGGVKNSQSNKLTGFVADAAWVLSTATPNPHYIKPLSSLCRSLSRS